MNGKSGALIRVLVSLPAAMFAQWGLSVIAGMFARIAMDESGQPVAIQSNLLFLGIVSCLAFLLVTVIFTAYFDRVPLDHVGWNLQGSGLQLLKGSLAPVIVLCLSAWVLSVTGHIQFNGWNMNGDALSKNAMAMLLIAFGEELFFRGYLQRNLQKVFTPWLALLISTLFFTLAHSGNPEALNPFALAGVATGGLLLGVNYLFTRNLWFGIALHFSWNYLQGPILGFAVSGLSMEPMLQHVDNGPAWLTGGAFGLEASLLAIMLNLIVFAVLWGVFSRQNPAEN